MTHLDELRALAEKWRNEKRDDRDWYTSHKNADELTELLGKVVVTDEFVEHVTVTFMQRHWKTANPYVTNEDKDNMRAAIESALGVTK